MTTTTAPGELPGRDRLFQAHDWLDRARYRVTGWLPGVGKYRDLAARLDEAELEIASMRRTLPLLSDVMQETRATFTRIEGKLDRLAGPEVRSARPALRLVGPPGE